MFIKRKIYPSLKKHLQKRQITVILGMRRTGKTTITRQLLSEIKSENKLYLDLERLDNRELFAEKNYENILKSLSARGIDFNRKAYLAIDEIQLLPEIASSLKYLYDEHKIKFIITGSSSFYLKNLFTESLAGRKKIFELWPLDFSEFLTFKNINFKTGDFLTRKFLASEYERLKLHYEEFIRFGGFPEVVLTRGAEGKKDLLADIISSYVNLDIKSLADFRNDKNTYNLIKMLAGRVGTKLDYAKLSRLTGISRPTVLNYLDFFEKTYLLKRVSVLTKNLDREIVKARKIYFTDNGLLNILAEVSSGTQFENAAFNQLKHFGSIRYYSLKTGNEIDFILDDKSAFEIKETPTVLDLKNLADLAGRIDIKKYHLIGRQPTPGFNNFIWGGDVR